MNKELLAAVATCALLSSPTVAQPIADNIASDAAAGPQSPRVSGGDAAGGQEAGIVDIVVTAQRRTENAQRTALSIAVIGGDSLRTRGLANPDDITKLVPGVQINGGATTQITVRGVGDFGTTAVSNPAVIVNLDGVTLGRSQAVSGNFYDVERVEVLRGPQGTLYGRNASGGVINILTVQPKYGEFSGYVEGTVGNYSQFGSEGAINVPIVEEAAARLSYQVNSRDGYLSDGSDDDKHESVRFQVKANPTPEFTVRGEFNYTHLGGNGGGTVVMSDKPGRADFAVPSSRWTGLTDPIAAAAYEKAAADAFAASGGKGIPPALISGLANFDLFQNIRSVAAQVQLDYDFGFATLTAIPAYRNTHSRFSVPTNFVYNVGGPYNSAGDRTDGEQSDQYSLEVRLGSESDRLKWVVGLFGFQEDTSTDGAIQGGLIVNNRLGLSLKTEAIAGFAQATFSATDRLRVTGGIRYTSDKRTAKDFLLFGISPTVLTPPASSGFPPIPCLPPPQAIAPVGSLCPLINQTPGYYDSAATFNRVTWKAGFEYDLAPRSLLFVDVSSGFKAGGFNMAVGYEDLTTLNTYKPETVISYNAGVKNRFFDNRLQLNVEGFYIDYTNLQLTAQSLDGGGVAAIVTQNAGKARSFGANLDVVANVWSGGTFRGAVEYLNSKYLRYDLSQPFVFADGQSGCNVSTPRTSDPNELVNVDCSGKPLVRAPRWSGVVGFSQEFGIADKGTLIFDADMTFASSRYLQTELLSEQKAKAYGNIALVATYKPENGRWLASLFVRNLTNAVIYTGGGGSEAVFVDRFISSAIAPPRTFGGRVQVRW
jgi:iron complex outermembrane receptor protein